MGAFLFIFFFYYILMEKLTENLVHIEMKSFE